MNNAGLMRQNCELARLACAALSILMVWGLFYLGSKPVAVGLFVAPWDKVAHGLFFSALTAPLWVAARGRAPLLIVIAVILVGGLDELHQTTLPGRTADWGDFIADALAGIGAGYFLFLRAKTRRSLNK